MIFSDTVVTLNSLPLGRGQSHVDAGYKLIVELRKQSRPSAATDKFKQRLESDGGEPPTAAWKGEDWKIGQNRFGMRLGQVQAFHDHEHLPVLHPPRAR